MPASPLSQEQLADAARLKNVWLAYKKSHPGASQEKLAFECGWKTQGAVTQYMNGKIPLNISALLKFSAALHASPDSISPSLAKQLQQAQLAQPMPELAARLASADEATRKLVEIALLENDESALSQLSPSLVAMVRGVKAVIAAQGSQAE